jgi:predicted dehydrogenase
MDPEAYQWRYDSRRANGVLGDLGSHLIDLALWVAGPIIRVSAFLAVFAQMRGPAGEEVPRANDSANLLVEFQNGAHGRICTSATTHEPFAMTVAVGGAHGYLKATFALWGDIGMSLIGRKAAEENATALPIPPGYLEGFPPNLSMFDAAVALLTDGTHFLGELVSAIRQRRPCAPSFRDGLEVMRVIDAALESARSGCAVNVG